MDIVDVTILMATRNGGRFLRAQLASIAQQSHANWALEVSDDGSTDDTIRIVEEFAAAIPGRRIRLLRGPERGSAANFLSLLGHADDSSAFYAFADQDDVWMPCRLARGLASARMAGPGPFLFGSGTTVTDSALRPRTGRRPAGRSPGFANALVQSIAGGNTMLFNRATLQLARAAGTARPVIAHDWWLYQLVSGAGGQVVFDPRPTLYYRQHGANLVGANRGIVAGAKRLRAVAEGRFARWNDANTTALLAVRHLLTAGNRDLLDAFVAARASSGLQAMRLLSGAGIRRHGRLGSAGLLAAAAAGRI